MSISGSCLCRGVRWEIEGPLEERIGAETRSCNLCDCINLGTQGPSSQMPRFTGGQTHVRCQALRRQLRRGSGAQIRQQRAA